MTRHKPTAIPLFIVLCTAACGPAPVSPRAAPEPPSERPPPDAGPSAVPPPETPDAGVGPTPTSDAGLPGTVDSGTVRPKLPAPDARAAEAGGDTPSIDAGADATPTVDADGAADAGGAADAVDAGGAADAVGAGGAADAVDAGGAADAVDAGGAADAVDAGGAADAETVRSPLAGEVVIVEALVNPGGQDAGREWIEILNGSGEARDLSGLHLADAAVDVAAPAGVIPAGGRLVLGQSADAGKNGGAPIAVAYGSRLALNNDGEEIAICIGPCAGGLVVDRVGWKGLGAAYDGHAVVFDRGADRICPATRPFGTGGDFGTPGGAEEGCPTPDAGF